MELYTSWSTVKDMCLDQRRFDIIMAKKFLNCLDAVYYVPIFNHQIFDLLRFSEPRQN